jgi:hypothetical protein
MLGLAGMLLAGTANGRLGAGAAAKLLTTREGSLCGQVSTDPGEHRRSRAAARGACALRGLGGSLMARCREPGAAAHLVLASEVAEQRSKALLICGSGCRGPHVRRGEARGDNARPPGRAAGQRRAGGAMAHLVVRIKKIGNKQARGVQAILAVKARAAGLGQEQRACAHAAALGAWLLRCSGSARAPAPARPQPHLGLCRSRRACRAFPEANPSVARPRRPTGEPWGGPRRCWGGPAGQDTTARARHEIRWDPCVGLGHEQFQPVCPCIPP